MTKRTPLNNVECKVNDNLSIIVSNAREVYGHDDSLPFNADVFISKDGKKGYVIFGIQELNGAMV